MDFIVGLPRIVKNHIVLWVIIDRLTKLTHFILDKPTYSVNKWTQIYMKEVRRLHGVSVSTVSDRNLRYTSSFWRSL